MIWWRNGSASGFDCRCLPEGCRFEPCPSHYFFISVIFSVFFYIPESHSHSASGVKPFSQNTTLHNKHFFTDVARIAALYTFSSTHCHTQVVISLPLHRAPFRRLPNVPSFIRNSGIFEEYLTEFKSGISRTAIAININRSGWKVTVLSDNKLAWFPASRRHPETTSSGGERRLP